MGVMTAVTGGDGILNEFEKWCPSVLHRVAGMGENCGYNLA